MYTGIYYIFTVAKNATEQKKKVIFQMISHAAFLLLTSYLYKHLYNLVPNLQTKLPLPNAIWSMAVYFMIFWLGVRNIERYFREDINSGNIEMYLLRPVGYIWQKVFVVIGNGLLPFISASILSIIISYIFIGLPVTDAPMLFWLLGILLILILSQILSCLIFIICGLTGFWLDNSEPVHFIFSKLIMILGGAWVPVAFFPKALQLVAQFSPFGGSMAISFAMYPNFLERFPALVLNIIFWIIVCSIIVSIMSRRGFRRLSVNG